MLARLPLLCTDSPRAVLAGRRAGGRVRIDLRQVRVAAGLRLCLRIARHLPLVPAAALLLVLAGPVPQLRGLRQPGGRRRGLHGARLPHCPRPAPRAAGDPNLDPGPNPDPNSRPDHRPRPACPVLQGKRPVREPFRNFMSAAKRHSHCVPFADHPLGSTMYDAPVVNVEYAVPLPTNARPQEVCSVGGTSGGFGGDGGGCKCGFRRLQGVDNAALAQAISDAYYGHAYYGHAYYGHTYYGHAYYGHAYYGHIRWLSWPCLP